MEEDILYEEILNRMLSQVPDTIDKREGSIIYDTLSPIAIEFLIMYQTLETLIEETYVDTASLEGLKKRCEERGVTVKEATQAVIEAITEPSTLEIAVGEKFNCDSVNYIVNEKLSDGVYKLICETAGEDGNKSVGTLIPINNINGLKSAKISRIIIPGENEDTEEELRQRYYDSVESQAFGGNQADYKEKVNLINGVGGVKVYRAWNDDVKPTELIPPDGTQAWINGLSGIDTSVKSWLEAVYAAASSKKITVGGTVKLVIIASDYTKPTAELIEQVQTAVDPEQNAGEGVGFAPIGHCVTVEGVDTVAVDITTNITYIDGYDWETSEPLIIEAIDEYFKELCENWESEQNIVIRISQIENKILNLACTLDIADTTINGAAQNLILNSNAIPTRGRVNG